ncbi:receptor-like cytoplasmic kinase 176 [Rosa sericea]
MLPVNDQESTRIEGGAILQSFSLKIFCYNELKKSTRNFRFKNVVGFGDSINTVYKGCIDEHSRKATKPGTGIDIAIKMPSRKERFRLQDQDLLVTEFNRLGQLIHPNLVKMIGYCLEDNKGLLVYEFMPRGSLGVHLHSRDPQSQPLSWNLRMKIALSAAKGLAFLHSDKAKMIYGDFKPSNILLDSNYEAKIYGYGLEEDDELEGYRRLRGHDTECSLDSSYAAPEYLTDTQRGEYEYRFESSDDDEIDDFVHLSPKSDVYSFGIVLLEMISGRQSLDNTKPMKERKLVQWAKPYLTRRRKVLKIIDDRIEGQYSKGGAIREAKLVAQCLSLDPKGRPNMNDVVKALEQLQESSGMAGFGICEDEPSCRNQSRKYQSERQCNNCFLFQAICFR